MNYAEKKKRRIELKNKLEEWVGKIIELTAEIEVLKKKRKEQAKVFMVNHSLTHSEVAGHQKAILKTKGSIDQAIKDLARAVRMEKETQEKITLLDK